MPDTGPGNLSSITCITNAHSSIEKCFIESGDYLIISLNS